MIKASLGLMALGLAGCATYSSIKDRAPLYEGTSAKSPSAITACVLPAWMNTNAATHIVADGGQHIVVMPTSGVVASQVMMTLTVAPNGSGSAVSMRTMPSVGDFKAQWDQVQSCL